MIYVQDRSWVDTHDVITKRKVLWFIQDTFDVGQCEVTEHYPHVIREPQAQFLQPYAYFHQFVIDEEWRGLGIGAALFNAMLIEAKKLNPYGVWWRSHYTHKNIDHNDPAVKIYAKNGVALYGTPYWYIEF